MAAVTVMVSATTPTCSLVSNRTRSPADSDTLAIWVPNPCSVTSTV